MELKSPRTLYLLLSLSLVLFAAGVALHGQAGRFDPATMIVGDEGDGLFNLWVLEHVHRTLPLGADAVSDGRIFSPAEKTFWWSDNLLIPGLMYSLHRRVGFSPFPAYAWTLIALSALGFAAMVWFFMELRRPLRSPSWTLFLAPLFAYLAFFSQTRLHDFLHFQSVALAFWVLLIVGILRHQRLRRRRDLLVMAAVLFVLMASAPYFAMLGACMILVWGLLLLADRSVNLKSLLLQQAGYTLPFVLATLAIAWIYVTTDPPDIPLDTLRQSALQNEHWFTPLSGWIRAAEPFGPWTRLHPGGYPGAGLLLALLFCTGLVVWKGRGVFRDRRFWIFVGLFALTCVKVREIKLISAGLRLGLVLVALAVFVCEWRKRTHEVWKMQALFLAGALMLTLGTAMGPGNYFKPENGLDPGVWGLFSRVLPGYGNMRELIRFSAAGHLLLFGAVWVGFLRLYRPRHRWAWAGMLALGVGLQLSENLAARIKITTIDPDHLQLTQEENEFFKSVAGSMLVVPAAPFHRNTQHMLRWVDCSDLSLLNGYSGRLPSGFAEIIRLENQHGRASSEQVEAALGQGADLLCVMRDYVPDAAEERVREGYPLLFENARFLVVDLRAHAHAGEGEVVADGIQRTDSRKSGGDAPGGFGIGLPPPGESETP